MKNSPQSTLQQQDNYDHLATVLMNCVKLNALSTKALQELWQYACQASFSEVYKKVLIDAIKEKCI